MVFITLVLPTTTIKIRFNRPFKEIFDTHFDIGNIKTYKQNKNFFFHKNFLLENL